MRWRLTPVCWLGWVLQDCEWTLTYANTAGDCVVSAQLRELDGSPIFGADTDGSLTLHVVSGSVLTAASGGVVVGSIDFAVTQTCSNFFTGGSWRWR